MDCIVLLLVAPFYPRWLDIAGCCAVVVVLPLLICSCHAVRVVGLVRLHRDSPGDFQTASATVDGRFWANNKLSHPSFHVANSAPIFDDIKSD